MADARKYDLGPIPAHQGRVQHYSGTDAAIAKDGHPGDQARTNPFPSLSPGFLFSKGRVTPQRKGVERPGFGGVFFGRVRYILARFGQDGFHDYPGTQDGARCRAAAPHQG
jgi:hypothetical protein